MSTQVTGRPIVLAVRNTYYHVPYTLLHPFISSPTSHHLISYRIFSLACFFPPPPPPAFLPPRPRCGRADRARPHQPPHQPAHHPPGNTLTPIHQHPHQHCQHALALIRPNISLNQPLALQYLITPPPFAHSNPITPFPLPSLPFPLPPLPSPPLLPLSPAGPQSDPSPHPEPPHQPPRVRTVHGRTGKSTHTVTHYDDDTL